jgi:CRISPR/Cas system-associated exonuclease Cas4 (RecB family)
MITAWSYSRYRDYIECPFKAKLKYVDKLKEPPSKAMERGSTIHKLAEEYVGGSLPTFPAELELFRTEIEELKGTDGVLVELEKAFTKTWIATDWFSRDAWLRVKYDVEYFDPSTNETVIIDYKTGRYNPGTYDDQLSIYALCGLLDMPCASVSAQLWFLDTGDIVAHKYVLEEKHILLKTWSKATENMLNDTTFKPTPGAGCQWCAFKKANGGPCQF